MRKPVFFFMSLMISFQVSNVEAKDLGVWGTTFLIVEEDLQEVILKRAAQKTQGGNLQKLQQAQILKAKKRLEAPVSGFKLPRSAEKTVSYYDPTYVLGRDISDDKGRVFARKGTTINPFQHIALNKTLVFLNANDEKQVAWLLGFKTTKPIKIILVEGNPIQLEEALQKPVYFDQAGVLVKKFNLRALPTVVKQEGHYLKLETVRLP